DGNFVFFQFATLGIENGNFAVALEHDVFIFGVGYELHAGEANGTAVFGLGFALFNIVLAHAADMEGTHGQLRARLANALRADDADRHAFFDQRAGGQIHAVTQTAYAEGGIASERTAN